MLNTSFRAALGGLSALLHKAPTLTGAYNTGYTARANALAQICSADAPQTSYSPIPLSEIASGGLLER